jgi:fibronectin-binding autotransporter adhesin
MAGRGYSRSTLRVNERRSSASSDNYHLGLYSGAQWGNLGLRSVLAYSWHDIKASRTARFPGFVDSLKSDYRAGSA